MSNLQLKYVLGNARYANADNLTGNIKLSLPLTAKPIVDSEILELVSLSQRYDKERQASPIHRIYGRLSFITTNELTNYDNEKISLINSISESDNYNLQILYPSSQTNDVSLKDFGYDMFPLTTSNYLTINDARNHKLYHGLPFVNSSTTTNRNRSVTTLITYKHKYDNNINADDYVYIIPSIGGTTNDLYGICKVNGTVTPNGTPNVLILDKTVSGTYGGSYKKITNPSDNDLAFLNPISCELYITSTTLNELFICTSEQHNVIVGDYIDLRESGGTMFNKYNGIHKVSRIISEFIYVCDVPSHIISSSILVPNVSFINPTIFKYQYRVLDGDPSEYYIRKFKVIIPGDNTTTIYGMDYSIQQLHLSNTIWKNVNPSNNITISCGTEKQSGSDDDRIVSYLFNTDINISQYTDNLGRPLTELYLGIIKRKDPAFVSLISNFQAALMYSGITTYDERILLPSLINPNTKTNLNYFNILQFNDAGFDVGKEYYGDLCEFSVETLQETILDPLQFRIGIADNSVNPVNSLQVEGYVYEPFKKIQIRYLSTDIEDLANTENVYPSYALPYHTTYRWKSIVPYGFKEITQQGINVVDRPFVNGAHYNFSDVSFYLRRQNKLPDYKITIYDTTC